CLLTLNYIISSAAAICADFPSLAQTIAAENWAQATQFYRQAHRKWQTAAKIWPLLIDHSDMQDIEIAFIDLQVMLHTQNREQALKEIAGLYYYLNHVPQNQRLSLQNIL
ncbi:MAG: DUF4363 family protein, partial [Clostridiales bacterium]